MKYIDDSLFDDTVAMLFQIIVKRESSDDLPVTFKGSFFTEEDLDSSRPLETLLDGLETALHLHVYENEDPIILKKQLLDASRQLVDVYREKEEESDLYSPMAMIAVAGDFRRNYVFKFDRKGNKKGFLKRYLRGAKFNQNDVYDPNRVENSVQAIKFAFAKIRFARFFR
tara:strand:+ start:541 stop:1050 length:510 start_codon:yes stop_codon:yes gene_type:complete